MHYFAICFSQAMGTALVLIISMVIFSQGMIFHSLTHLYTHTSPKYLTRTTLFILPYHLIHTTSFIPLLLTTLANGQTFLCDAALATPLCPGTTAVCTCGVTAGQILTQWTFPQLHPCLQKFDRIQLTQVAPCSSNTSAGNCGPSLTAANKDPAIYGAACSFSTLTVTADPSMNGLVIECQNPISGSTIGNATVTVLCKLQSRIIHVNT